MCRRLIYPFSFALWLGLVLTNAAEAADPSLVLYLSFNEGAGTPHDFSVYENEVELVNNPIWVDGKYGKALEFNGSNYVRVPINETLQLRESFTVEYWVQREDSQPATWNYMVAGGTLMWAVIVNADQNVYVWSRSGGTWGQRLVTSIPLTTDWTHIALTYDVGSGVELFFNGEKAGEGGTPPIVDEIDGSIMVGARNPGQEFFSGIIDEVALYNRILTLDEIRADMKAVGEPWPYAIGPTPPDGALHEDTWVNLSWSSGDFAASHDVYIDDNFENVNVGFESTFQGNQTDTFFVVGFPGFAFPDGLVPGTTYFWRIDEVNDTEPNSPWKGDVWSFMIPPKTAYF
ncbi:MAG: LamG domain-containing protein, partial [Planctomycetes bacterium]|nr:LamG domain-containing protein [Planctomycetota bacterium]